VHYCVANIPGAVARTSTLALTSATLPYLVRVAAYGVAGAAAGDPVLAKGLSMLGSKLVSRPVAQAHGLPYRIRPPCCRLARKRMPQARRQAVPQVRASPYFTYGRGTTVGGSSTDSLTYLPRMPSI
jgi:hypothetical protein